MTAPRDIVDSIECVLSIYFSDVRHNLRAAFILCDELVEVTLRARIKERLQNPGHLSFYALLTHAETQLDPKTHLLGKRLQATHNTRNDMQHNNPAAAVDVQYCADAVCDAVECAEHCFPGAKSDLPDRLRVALRVVHIYSTEGNPAHRNAFENAMLKHPWRGQAQRATVSERVVVPGRRCHWGLVVMSELAAIDTILRQIDIA